MGDRDWKRAFCILHGVFGGPADVLEQRIGCAGRVGKTDEPVAAVRCWAEDRRILPKGGERFCNVMSFNAGDVGADHKAGALGGAQQARHPVAEVARALRQARQVGRPDAALEPFVIRSNGQNDVPTGVAQPAQQLAGLMAKPPSRIGQTDIRSETRFDATGSRFFHHDNEGVPPQSARTII